MPPADDLVVAAHAARKKARCVSFCYLLKIWSGRMDSNPRPQPWFRMSAGIVSFSESVRRNGIGKVPISTALSSSPKLKQARRRPEELPCEFLLVVLLAISNVAFAAEPDALIGNWQLVSWQVIVENEVPQHVFGPDPKGYLILTREGRSIVVTTADSRKGRMGDAERAALHKSMLAYSGKYRVEGSDFITTVNVSWNEVWNGTEQRRHFRIEGDRLFIESASAPSIIFPCKTDFRRIVWEREK
jgi:hypothetical protein